MTPESPAVLPEGTHIGRTALRVGDRAELTEFYRRVVGLSVLTSDETRTTLGVEGAPLLVLEDTDEPTRHRSGAGLYHNAFRVPSRRALGDALARVRAHWQLGGASDHLVSEALYLTDPEGNGVELYRDLPREAWPVDDDGTIRMGTDPLDLERLAEAAADATGDSRAPPGTDVGHVHLEVSSLSAFDDFYVDTLGFEPQTRVPAARFVSAGGYHHHVGANTWHNRTAPLAGRGLAWFEVVLPSREAIESVRRRIVEAGFAVTDVADGSGVTDVEVGFTVTDPDDIKLRLRAA